MGRRDATEGLKLPPPSSTDPLTACEAAKRNLEVTKVQICQYLEAVLREVKLPSDLPPEKGQEIARRINDLLTDFGARLRIPGTDVPATLGYPRRNTWVFSGQVEGVRTNRSLGESALSRVEVIPAPAGFRPGRRRSEERS